MKPQYILHKLSEGFIITSSEEVTGKQGFNTKTNQIEFFASHPKYDEWGLKVIAQQDQIDFSALSEEEQNKIGWFDVEKLAYENAKNSIKNHKEQDISTEIWISGARVMGFKEGFQKAQELLSDRRFTLEDMRKELSSIALEIATEDGSLSSCLPSLIYSYIENKLQSLSQPKSWKVIGNWEISVLFPYHYDKFKITKIL